MLWIPNFRLFVLCFLSGSVGTDSWLGLIWSYDSKLLVNFGRYSKAWLPKYLVFTRHKLTYLWVTCNYNILTTNKHTKHKIRWQQSACLGGALQNFSIGALTREIEAEECSSWLACHAGMTCSRQNRWSWPGSWSNLQLIYVYSRVKLLVHHLSDV